MVKAAIKKGGASIGFSEHSFVPFDLEYSMSLEDTPKYIDEINFLKQKYEGEIDIFLGLEVDYFTDYIPDGLDYIIGALHHVEKDSHYITVDGWAEKLEDMTKLHFGGDFYAVADLYYKTFADIITKTNADIVAHFDLIVKNNTNGSMLDEMHPGYIKSALDAMDQILEKCKIFEINTGAMFRRGKTIPYPSLFLLEELFKRGGEIILSSDSHNSESLYFKFDEMKELVKSFGFKYIKRFTRDGFIDERI